MSAITGIFYRDGRSVDPELIEKMNNKLAHRGPDGSSTWCEGHVALGHQMLFTTPESLHEKLPFENEDTGLVITADARIDNRAELSELLKLENTKNVSDSKFILKAYEKWGEDCPDKLLGDFAFAIWDQNDEKLFCARDHMGVKPFYYYLSDELFAFASEIKALFSIPNVPHHINEIKIAYHLSLIEKDREITSYKNILRLPAAYSIIVRFKTKILNEYWALDLNYKIQLNSDEEYEKFFRDIFTEAVKCRLRSAFPVGSMLSGGLDSSSVTCIAQKILQTEGKNRLKTFSAIFDSVPESNERYFIEKVLSSSEFESYYIKADEISPLKEIDSFFFYGDQPFVAPNTFMIWNIYREANNNGVRILLDGLEGDITVSHGDGFFLELARTKRWKKLIFEVKRKSQRTDMNPYKTILIIFFNILIPNSFKIKIQLWREHNKKEGSKSKILKKEFSERMGLLDDIAKIIQKNFKATTAHQKHYYDLKSGFIQFEMELVDWMAVPFLIELRHPFFDKRLVEFCLAIPTEQKFSNGWDRSIMRHAMSNIIPTTVQWRKEKTKLSHNFNHSLRNYEKELIDDLMMKTPSIMDYVDMNKLQEIYNHYKSGENKDSVHIWNSLILYLWIRKNFNNKLL